MARRGGRCVDRAPGENACVASARLETRRRPALAPDALRSCPSGSPATSAGGTSGLDGSAASSSGALNADGATSLSASGWNIDASSSTWPRAMPSSPIPPPYIAIPFAAQCS